MPVARRNSTKLYLPCTGIPTKKEVMMDKMIMRPSIAKAAIITTSIINRTLLAVFMSYDKRLGTAQSIGAWLQGKYTLPKSCRKISWEDIEREEFEDESGPIHKQLLANTRLQRLRIPYLFKRFPLRNRQVNHCRCADCLPANLA